MKKSSQRFVPRGINLVIPKMFFSCLSQGCQVVGSTVLKTEEKSHQLKFFKSVMATLFFVYLV